MPEFKTEIQHRVRPQGSKTPYRHRTTGRIILVEANKGLKESRAQLSQELIALAVAQNWERPAAHIPVKVKLTFYYKPSKSNKLEHFTMKPDGDKLERYTFDACKPLWYDDCQVIKCTWRKRWSTVDKVEIRIRY